MEESILDLKNKFKEIKNMGYIKSVNNNYSGIGLTFEYLLGKKVDDFSFPDYQGIEIKTKIYNSTKPVTLFKSTPEGKDFFETKRLWSEYGYYNDKSKVFYISIFSNKIIKLKNNYSFKLNVNYRKKCLEMYVFYNDLLIDDNTYWSFERIENVLIRKLQYLSIIIASDTIRKGEKYYKYNKMTIYKLKSFKDFLSLLEKGMISVSFCIDTYKSGKRKGQIHDHGTSFCIFLNNIEKLFNRID